MRADRLVAIILLLQVHKKLTAKALAARLEVSLRTILRDVEAISRSGIPIYSNGGRGGGITLDENYRVTLTGLNEAEVHTFFISGNKQLFKDIGLGNAAENALLKLSAAVPTHYQPSIEFMRQRVYIDPLWWWHDADPQPFLTELQQAVYTSRCVRACYKRRNGEVTEQIIEPYSLVAKSSTWYLIARRDGAMRTYRISRFDDIMLLDTPFLRADDFDLPTYWQQQLQDFASIMAEYTFTLRIHVDGLPFVKRLLPGRYTITQPDTGDGWLTTQFHVEYMDLAKMLAFGLGTRAIVIEPPELREAVMQTAREVLDRESSPAG